MKTIEEIHRENLQALAHEFGGVAAVSAKIGCSSSQFSQWLNGSENSGTGKPRGMRPSSARRIEQACGKPNGWMDRPHDEHEQGMKTAIPVEIAEQADPELIEIRMVKLRLQAGVTGFRTELDRREGGTLAVRRRWVEKNNYDPARLVAVLVDGDSMETKMSEDDIIVINTADTRMVDGKVFAVNYDGEAVVKRLSRDGGMWWLTSDNPDQHKYHRKSIQGAECIMVGRVVLVIKESEDI